MFAKHIIMFAKYISTHFHQFCACFDFSNYNSTPNLKNSFPGEKNLINPVSFQTSGRLTKTIFDFFFFFDTCYFYIVNKNIFQNF